MESENNDTEKVKLIRVVLNGVVSMIRALRCKITCCAHSECNQRAESPNESPVTEL